MRVFGVGIRRNFGDFGLFWTCVLCLVVYLVVLVGDFEIFVARCLGALCVGYFAFLFGGLLYLGTFVGFVFCVVFGIF